MPGLAPERSAGLPAGVASCLAALSQPLDVENMVNVPGVPFPLSPSPAGAWKFDEQTGTVVAKAGPRTDIFIDPGGSAPVDAESMLNAATLLGVPPAGDFQLSARATVGFGAAYDAGVLLLWIDERHWGKLCFEYSPAREPVANDPLLPCQRFASQPHNRLRGSVADGRWVHGDVQRHSVRR